MADFIHEYLSSPYFNFRCYIIHNRFIPISDEFVKSSGSLIPYITINNSHPDKEASRLNKIFEIETGCPNIISSKTITNIDIAVINILRFNPIWGVKVDSVITDKFMGIDTHFIKFCGQSFGLFEDAEKLIIEIPCKKNNLVFGIIDFKMNNYCNIEEKDIAGYTENLNITVIDELLLPKIMKREKIRLNNILKMTDLKLIFMDTDLPNIFPEKGGNINQVIQYCDIIITEQSSKFTGAKGYQVMRKIKINKSFSYYIRYVPKNVILSFGHID